MNNNLMVTIRCLVYNHAPFIRQCLDGIVMQKTNFRFEAIVHDDASTDSSADIIREYAEKYPDIIKPIFQTENQYSKHDGSIQRILNYNTHGKYVAVCEGDDYWTDPLKLQKQVDILENNKEFGCVYTAFEDVDVNGNPVLFPPSIEQMNRSFTGDIFYEQLISNFPKTLTVLYRKELAEMFSPPISLDSSTFLAIAIQSKFYYLPEKTGAYRINSAGMVQSGNLFKIDVHPIKLYYYTEYLRNKCYWRAKLEDKKIKDVLFHIKLWNFRTLVRYHKYFVKIATCNPYIALRILKHATINTINIIKKKIT